MEKDSNFAMFDEINEELKRDQIVAFIRKNLKTAISVIVAAILGIIIYSTWQERQKRKMEDVTNALLTVVQNSSEKNGLMLDKLLKSAPSQLRPILALIRNGKQLRLGNGTKKNMNSLLDLANKSGVDIIWKDLASLMYVSYSGKSAKKLIELIKPLTNEGRPFKFSAMEFAAIICVNNGMNREAFKYIDRILASKDAPENLKKRVIILSRYIKDKMRSESA